jgi:glutamine amidotransferase
MNVILDYKVGNLDSIQRGLARASIDAEITSDPTTIEAADLLILPGVGAFGDAIADLRDTGLVPLIERHVQQGKPLIGVCLGMQLLFEESTEFGRHKGLGFLPGTVELLEVDRKIPHMGWNALRIRQNDPVVSRIQNGDYVYFVHSYYAKTTPDVIVATTDYDVEIPAIVRKDNVIGMQFHPEKSGEVGLRLLETLQELIR